MINCWNIFQEGQIIKTYSQKESRNCSLKNSSNYILEFFYMSVGSIICWFMSLNVFRHLAVEKEILNQFWFCLYSKNAYTIFLEYINMSESLQFVDRQLCSYKNWVGTLFPCQCKIVRAVKIQVFQAVGSHKCCCAVLQAKVVRMFWGNFYFVQWSPLGNVPMVFILVSVIVTSTLNGFHH